MGICFTTASGVTTNTSGLATCSNSNCEFDCTGLSANVEYSITIYGINGHGNGPMSNAKTATTLDTQRTFLQALYTDAGGANWGYGNSKCPKDTTYTSTDATSYWGTSGTFNSTGDYCDTTASWSGVQCDSNGLIIDLSLDSFYMVGTIPTEIGTLTGLTNLNFARNPNNFKTIGATQAYCQFTAFQRGTDTTGGAGGLSGSIPTEIGNLV